MSDENKKDGFFSLPNDNIVKTIVVALMLCLFCSVIVSTAATVLKPKQVANKLLDKKRNILSVAGLDLSTGSVDELFSQIEEKIVDLETGQYTDAVDLATFDQRKASKDPAYRVALDKDEDIAQIGGYSKYANVYLVKDGDRVSKYILPVKGYALWSTMYGFICLEADANTACNISFYEHAETPGLGGEIDNKKWQATWAGKQIADSAGVPKLHLIKGQVNSAMPDAEYKIDGLAGATLTSIGVTNMVQFWLGENGFGPYLKNVRQQSGSDNDSDTSSNINSDANNDSNSNVDMPNSVASYATKQG